MRIGLFSDIHANLPALEAFFIDVEGRNVDMLFCLGDLVGYNVWPNEVINAIRDRKIGTIAGNYDVGVGRNSDDCGCAYKTQTDQANGARSIAFTNETINDEERTYLRNLPAHMRFDFPTLKGKLNLLLVHGSPRKVNEYLFEDREEHSFARMMEQAEAHIMCFGHTHKPFHRVIKSSTGEYRHAVNIGSVGKPKDNDPRGCYVILTVNENSNLAYPGSLGVEFIRFSYNVEAAAKAIEESKLPNEYADMLRKGY